MLQQRAHVWDVVAPLQGISDRLTAPVHRLAIDRLGLRAGESVLDIGCGAGAMLPLLRSAVGETGRVTGIDRSGRMLARAHRRLAPHGWTNVTLRCGDVSRDPLGAGEFDAAVAVCCLSATPDVPTAVRGAADALRPGGRLFVFDLRLVPGGPGWLRGTTRLARLGYRTLAGFTGADVLAELRTTFGPVEEVLPRQRTGDLITAVLARRPG